MKLPEKLDIREFSYELPAERIARYPLGKRDDSKLLVYREKKLSSHYFRDLPGLIDCEYAFIFNDTRVIMARLLFSKESGASIEVFLLEPYEPADYTSSLGSNNETKWICLVGNAKKWKSESLVKNLIIRGKSVTLSAFKVSKTGNSYIIRFSWNNREFSFSEIIAGAGAIPIPPYLNREAEINDVDRYQTIYSRYEGSVAAPTAGLHFTNSVLEKIGQKGINRIDLTLHVGAGTFIPVKTDDAIMHDMHTEQLFASYRSIEELYRSEKRHLAIGTTAVRSLESLYRVGIKIKACKTGSGSFFLDQWESYSISEDPGRKESMGNILSYMDRNQLEYIHVSTKIMIIPGFNFRMTDGMLTNFHQPQSTLLLLIAAYTGSDWKRIYDYAMSHDYRFLSYGDSSLLLP